MAGASTPRLVILKTMMRAHKHNIILRPYPHANSRVVWERGGGTETGKEESLFQIPPITVRPKTRGRTLKSVFPSRDSVLGKWVIWENFSSEPSALPNRLSIIGPNAAPFRTQDSSKVANSLRVPFSTRDSSQRLRAACQKISLPETNRLTPLHTLFRTGAPLPGPSHTRSHPPKAPGTPPFSLCPKREKKPRHEAS